MLTLTYATEHLPRNDKGIVTLLKKHATEFRKKVQREQKKRNETLMRYFLTGEYGTRRKRPHYHLIAFNLSERILRKLPTLWPYGHVDIQQPKANAISYVTKYLIDEDRNLRGQRQKPFNMMSKRPGLGHQYLEKNRTWHKATEGTHVEDQKYYVISNGFKQNIPRYYKKKIFTDWDIKAHGTLARIKKAKELERLISTEFKWCKDRQQAMAMIQQRVKQAHDLIKIKSEKRNKL